MVKKSDNRINYISGSSSKQDGGISTFPNNPEGATDNIPDDIWQLIKISNAATEGVGNIEKEIKVIKKNYEKQVGNLKIQIENTKTEIQKIKEKTESMQIKSIEMLGVFVALFTFVSLDFSILKSSVSLGVSVSLILIAGGLLLSFLLLMHFILFQELGMKFFSKAYLLWLIIISLIASGIFFLNTSLKKYEDAIGINNQNNLNLQISNEIKKQ